MRQIPIFLRPALLCVLAYALPVAAQTPSPWLLQTTTFSNDFTRQATLGNGYLGLRVPAAGMGYLGGLGTVGWPLATERITSAVAAGVFARTADGHWFTEQKDALALIPNWSTLNFADSSGTYSAATASAAALTGYTQSLDLATGILTTAGTWRSPAGRQIHFQYRVFTDRARPHLAAVELQLTPDSASPITVSSSLDQTAARRLEPVFTTVDLPTHTLQSTSRTLGTGIVVAEAATLQSTCPTTQTADPQTLTLTGPCTLTKFVAVVTGRDSPNPQTEALAELRQATQRGLPALESENNLAWQDLWSAAITVDGDPRLQLALRASQFHLFTAVNPTTPGSLGPSGLSSDGYAGTVFWDADTWMFPALLAQHPALARVLVDYRAQTLPAALQNARDNGYQGALFPWTSSLKGDMGDECYGAVVDAHRKIIADPNKSCTQQFHLQSDIALAQWQYYQATADKSWLAQKGWPVIQAVAEFWAAKATPTPAGAYAILNIQTPDEYATDTDNDAYTNAGAAQALQVATQAAAVLGQPAPPEWSRIAAGLIQTIPVDREHNLYREHDHYTGQLIKQADVVMLTYPLDFPSPPTYAVNALNFYTPRTDRDGPAMTDAIYSIAAATLNGPGCSAYTYTLRSSEPYLRPPWLQFSEFAPTANTATAFNFLTGVGGFLQEFLFGYSGLRFHTAAVTVDPSLPPQIAGYTLPNLQWQGRVFTMHLGPKETTLTLVSGPPLPIQTPAGPRTLTT